jgi:DNA repair ATPase RecN
MKKTILYIALSTISISLFLSSCESKAKKVEEATVNVEEAKNDLKDAKAELNAEYPTFKSDAEIRIAENETRIAELRAILNKPGKLPLDPLRKKEIDDLEERNAQLKNRLYGYENERTDWINFKNEFNRDMDEMGEAFKNLGKKNLK